MKAMKYETCDNIINKPNRRVFAILRQNMIYNARKLAVVVFNFKKLVFFNAGSKITQIGLKKTLNSLIYKKKTLIFSVNRRRLFVIRKKKSKTGILRFI